MSCAASPGGARFAPARRTPWWHWALVALLVAWTSFVYVDRLVIEAWHGLHGNDFKHVYIAARLMSEGISPYDREEMMRAAELMGVGAVNPYVYLPSTSQLLMPLGWMSYGAALRTWFVLNHLFIWGGFALLIFATGALRRRAWLAIAIGAYATFASFAVARTLTAGQLNAALFFGYAAVFFCLSQRSERLAGVAAAFAAFFKITPGILGPFLLATRRWQAAIVMTVAGVVLLGVGLIMTPPATWLEFLPVASDMGYGKSTWGNTFTFYKDPYNVSFNATLHRLLVDDGTTKPWVDAGAGVANGLSLALGLGALALMLAAAWRNRVFAEASASPDHEPPPFDALSARGAWSVCILASLLIPSLYWDHYNTIALAALLPLLWHPATERCVPMLALAWVIAAIWGLWFPHSAPTYVLGGGMVPRGWSWLPSVQFSAREGVGLLFTSLKLWPTLVLLGWATIAAFRRPQPPAVVSADAESG